MLNDRIAAFVQLGRIADVIGRDEVWPGSQCGLTETEFVELNEVVRTVHHHNGWFTETNVRHAMRGIGIMMQEASLKEWLTAYNIPDNGPARTVAIIAAGNVPIVAWHDLLCVLLSGNKAMVKLSSSDNVLIPAMMKVLGLFSPDLAARATLTNGRLNGMDAVIATGSNNTARYFEHYLNKYPCIIRKGRTSVAILTGNETKDQMAGLAEDVFRYFGLGCRNVSKIHVPMDYDLNKFFAAVFKWKDIIDHSKYSNNYDYNKAVWMLDKVDLLENGFLLLKEDTSLVSPVASMYYERYTSLDDLERTLAARKDELQCIIGEGHLPFGTAQTPGPADCADGIDTMEFLLKLDHGATA